MAANKRLNATITIGGAISATLKSAFSTTTDKLKGVTTEIGSLTRAQKNLSTSIQVFGRMGKNVDGLRAKYAAVTESVARLRAEQARLEASDRRREQREAISGKMRSVGTTMMAAGAVIGAPVVLGVKEATHYQGEQAKIRAMGLSKDDLEQAFAATDKIKQFGVSKTEMTTLMRDALGAFGDVHHAEGALPFMAKMKFANSAVFGGEAAEKTEASFRDLLKTAEMMNAATPERFAKLGNIIQQVISGSGGAVGPGEWRNFVARGGVSVARMDPDAMYRMSHMIGEMGGDTAGQSAMSAYQNVAVGKTTKQAMLALQRDGLIADRSKVTPDKSGQLAHIGPGALKGYDLFVTDQLRWNKEVLVPTLRAKGMSDKKVEQAISEIFSNRNAAALHIRAFQQQAVLDKTEAVNRRAENVDQLEADGRKTGAGKKLGVEAQYHNLNLRMGTALLPAYTAALTVAADALERLNRFSDENPRLSQAMFVGLGALAGVLAIGGPILIGLSILPAAISGVTAAFGLLSAAALPIALVGAAVVALGAAAYLVYKNWEPIKKFFTDLWNDIGNIFDGGIGRVVSKFGTLFKYTTIPGLMFGGLHDAFAGDSKVAPAAAASAMPPMASPRGAGGHTVHDNSQVTIQVVQQPGQSHEDLAKTIARVMRQQQGVKNRSIMYDSANP